MEGRGLARDRWTSIQARAFHTARVGVRVAGGVEQKLHNDMADRVRVKRHARSYLAVAGVARVVVQAIVCLVGSRQAGLKRIQALYSGLLPRSSTSVHPSSPSLCDWSWQPRRRSAAMTGRSCKGSSPASFPLPTGWAFSPVRC